MKITTLKVTKLLKQPVQSTNLKDTEQIDLKEEVVYKVNSISKQGSYSKVTLPYGQGDWYIFNGHWDISILDREVVSKVYENVKDLDKTTKQLNDCLFRFDISTPKRFTHFLSQTAHESMGLYYEYEAGDNEYLSYLEGREDLGNTEPGYGLKYRGVDPIQMTGYFNYKSFSTFVNDPRVMEGYLYVKDNYKFLPSGYFWDNNKLNALCDNEGTVEQITKRINGGYNGLEDRKKRYKEVCGILLDKMYD